MLFPRMLKVDGHVGTRLTTTAILIKHVLPRRGRQEAPTLAVETKHLDSAHASLGTAQLEEVESTSLRDTHGDSANYTMATTLYASLGGGWSRLLLGRAETGLMP